MKSHRVTSTLGNKLCSQKKDYDILRSHSISLGACYVGSLPMNGPWSMAHRPRTWRTGEASWSQQLSRLAWVDYILRQPLESSSDHGALSTFLRLFSSCLISAWPHQITSVNAPNVPRKIDDQRRGVLIGSYVGHYLAWPEQGNDPATPNKSLKNSRSATLLWWQLSKPWQTYKLLENETIYIVLGWINISILSYIYIYTIYIFRNIYILYSMYIYIHSICLCICICICIRICICICICICMCMYVCL